MLNDGHDDNEYDLKYNHYVPVTLPTTEHREAWRKENESNRKNLIQIQGGPASLENQAEEKIELNKVTWNSWK